jgi:hypothetical protein
MNLENIMQSERSHSQKTTLYDSGHNESSEFENLWRHKNRMMVTQNFTMVMAAQLYEHTKNH